jgi:hypothetical protein
MRRTTGVPISPTRDAATTGTRTIDTDLSSSLGGTPFYRIASLPEPDETRPQSHRFQPEVYYIPRKSFGPSGSTYNVEPK